MASYDQSLKCIPYKQYDDRWGYLPLGNSTINDIGCALTCVAMCMRKSPKVLWNDGFRDEEVQWKSIGDFYGKTYVSGTSATLKNLVKVLKSRPAIVGVGGHFVVVYKFVGNTISPTKSMFYIHDPARDIDDMTLDYFDSFLSIRYYK